MSGRSLEEIKASLLAADEANEDKPERRSVATQLIETALGGYSFHISGSGEPFAVTKRGPRIAQLLRGGTPSLRSDLARHYFEQHGKAAAQQALADAMNTLEGYAQADEPVTLFQRVALHDGDQWLDMGDQTGRAIRVTPDGWSVEPHAPVLFRRTQLTSALPDPEPGDLNDLWDIVNVAPEDRALLLAWLVAALRENIPHPILAPAGEQGSGKSTLARCIVQLIDPSPAPTRKEPRDAEAWVTSAHGSWLLAIDNVSRITPWFADSLCRASTGEGDVRRRLYSDAGLVVFSFRRVVVLTSIDLGSVPGDLADRLLPVQLDLIPDTARREEAELTNRFEVLRPQLLGALLDLAARVARVLPSVRLERKPRMADFSLIVAAVDQVLGTAGLTRYLGARQRLANDTLAGDSLTVAITERIQHPWEGTAGELLVFLEDDEDARRPRDWPRNARAATQQLRRQAPALRLAGWIVEDDGGANKQNVLRWYLQPPRPEKAEKRASPPSPPLPVRSPRDKLGEDSPRRPSPLSSPTSPPSPDPRREKADADGQTSQARVARVRNEPSLVGDPPDRLQPPGAPK